MQKRSRSRRSRRKVRRWLVLLKWSWLFILPLWLVVNWCYHALRKPSEVVGIFDSRFFKSPQGTWKIHGDEFRENATPIISSQLLAALAQVETQGNSVARTYWRWKWSTNPFQIYAPASSAVGMFQMTDGTFEIAKKFCIHEGHVATIGRWYDPSSCWFNFLYSRVIPSDAVEMTAAYLHVMVLKTLDLFPNRISSLRQKQNLATVIHLCGPGRGQLFVLHKFRVGPNEVCGAHRLSRYLHKVQQLEWLFRQYSRETS